MPVMSEYVYGGQPAGLLGQDAHGFGVGISIVDGNRQAQCGRQAKLHPERRFLGGDGPGHGPDHPQGLPLE